MSRLTARTALDQVVGRPALIAPQYVSPIGGIGEGASSPMLSDLRELATADHDQEIAAAGARRASLASAYFQDVPDQDKPFAFANGYAIIPIHGMLINRFTWSWGFVTGYNFIRSQVQAAEADDDVTGVIFDVNSYGGMVSGCQETADIIAAAKKPSVAVIDANCYSAAYFLASQANGIYVTPSGGVGSIGVVLMHLDCSKALDQMGLAVTFIIAGSHKVDGNSAEPLSDDAREAFQASVDATYDVFVATVATGRGMDEQAVRDTEARCYGADDALTLGLIDAIQNPSDAVESFFAGCDADDEDDGTGDDPDNDPPEQQENSAMPPVNRTAPTATATTETVSAEETARIQNAAASDARTAERARISGITQHAEAAGRTELAAYLAYDTDLSVEDAGKMLAKAPKAAAAAPPAPGAEPRQQPNRFAEAMGNTPNPNVGADGGGAEETANVPASKRILASYRGRPDADTRH